MFNRRIKATAIWSFILSLFLLVVSCAVNPVTGEHELMLLSEADEIKLGKQTDGQIIKQYGIYQDHELSAYIDDLCQRLTKLSHRPNLPYECRILDASVVNAFAVPGGYMYYTRGILAYLNSEAELAGVMGHELGHITARHSAQQYSKAQLAQIGLGLGMALSETLRGFGELAQLGVQMLFLKFSRDNERQADDLGVEYSSKAGYDATQMANFFATLDRMHSSSDRSGLPSWFSTHPDPGDRLNTVRMRAREWQRQLGPKNFEINRDNYLKGINGLVFGEDPREGFVENSIFYHPNLRFQFPVPANWKLKNTPSQVGMASPEKDAIIIFAIARASSPREAAQAFVQQSQPSVLRSGSVAVNGLPGYRLISQVRSEQGALGALSYFIQQDNRIYVFHGISPVGKFNAYGSVFESTMSQFKELTDPLKLEVVPARVRIRPALTAGSLRETLRAFGTPDDQLEQLALLNGKSLDDQISANTLLKVIANGS